MNLPSGVVPRGHYWLWERLPIAAPGRWRVLVRRQRYADIEPHFNLGVLLHRWWSWGIVLDVWRVSFRVWRMHETTGA